MYVCVYAKLGTRCHEVALLRRITPVPPPWFHPQLQSPPSFPHGGSRPHTQPHASTLTAMSLTACAHKPSSGTPAINPPSPPPAAGPAL